MEKYKNYKLKKKVLFIPRVNLLQLDSCFGAFLTFKSKKKKQISKQFTIYYLLKDKKALRKFGLKTKCTKILFGYRVIFNGYSLIFSSTTYQ